MARAKFGLVSGHIAADSASMRLRRASGGLGIGAGLSLVLLHAVHVLAISAPLTLGVAVDFVCHIR